MKRGRIIAKNKAQTQLSFQTIFSILLVAIVIFVGFYVIRMFLDRAEQAKINAFVTDLRNKAIEIWSTEGASEVFNYNLNKKIERICFTNASTCQSNVPGFCNSIDIYRGENENLFFLPLGVVEKYKAKSAQELYCNDPNDPPIKCIDVKQTTCILVTDGKISLRLLKENETSLIKIRQA